MVPLPLGQISQNGNDYPVPAVVSFPAVCLHLHRCLILRPFRPGSFQSSFVSIIISLLMMVMLHLVASTLSLSLVSC